ncbi:MAG: DUF6331 family protein [Bacteroidales bacterium]
MNKDISIGKDKWIKWIDFDHQTASVYDIDQMIEPITGFLELFETECVAECCGINAFAFWPEDIQIVKKDFNCEDLLIKFQEIKKQLMLIQSEVVNSHFLNQLLRKEVFVKLIEHLIAEINTTPTQKEKQTH